MFNYFALNKSASLFSVCSILIAASSALWALEPEDVTYDGSVLTVPYVSVGEAAYEVKFIPTSDPVLASGDCPILCLKLLSATESGLSSARNPATFNGTTLTTPRVVLDNDVMSGQFTYLTQYNSDVYFSGCRCIDCPKFQFK